MAREVGIERFHWLLGQAAERPRDIWDVVRRSRGRPGYGAGDSASEGRTDETPKVSFLPQETNATFQGRSSFKAGRGKERHCDF